MKTQVMRNKDGTANKWGKRVPISHGWQLVYFILAQVLIFGLLFETVYTIQYSPAGLYFNFASWVLEGQVPYRDFNLEYPPLALLFFVLPGLLADNYIQLGILFRIEVLIFSVIGLLVLYDIARRLGKAPWKLLLPYTLCILAIGPIIGEQYDIIPAIFTLLALYCFWLGKHKTSWVFLALGVMTKIYPVVIAPIFIIWYIRNRQYRLIWTNLLIFAGICLAIVLPFLVISPDSIWNLFSYHSQRGIQIESTYASLLLAVALLGLSPVGLIMNFGSWNIESPVADVIAGLSTFLLVVFLILSFWFIYRQTRPGEAQIARLGACSLLVVSITLITSKILSPQYLIWLIPLVPLILTRWRHAVLGVFIGAGIMTYYIFPHNYLSLLNLDPGVVTVLILRNILVVLITWLSVLSLQDMKTSD